MTAELDDWQRAEVVYQDYETQKLTAAIHMLHEQAHGAIPFRSCSTDPCRTLYLDLRGPAPLTLPLGGGW